MSNMSPASIARYSESFPLLVTDPLAHYSESIVTQGHADYCAEFGHAQHPLHGLSFPFCVRCGDTLEKRFTGGTCTTYGTVTFSLPHDGDSVAYVHTEGSSEFVRTIMHYTRTADMRVLAVS